MTPLPSAPVVTGELRALLVYDKAPPDCSAVLVPHDRFAPHLRRGETAIIDPDDAEPQHGEIYLVTISDPREPDGVVLKFVQLRARRDRYGRMLPDGRDVMNDEDSIGWFYHFSQIRPRPANFSREDLIADLESGRESLCDGPLGTDGMRRKIVGPVVGVVPAG